MASNLVIPSEDHKDNAKTKRDEIKNLLINDEISKINKRNEETNEGHKRDVNDDESNTKVVRNIESGNNYLMCDEITLNDTVDVSNDGNISNEREGININARPNETLETNKNARYNSIYSTNRKHNQIGSKDACVRLDKTNIVYHQQKEKIIAMETTYIEKNNNSYDNQEMTYIVDIPSKKQNYNATKDTEDEVNNNSKAVDVLLPPPSTHRMFFFLQPPPPTTSIVPPLLPPPSTHRNSLFSQPPPPTTSIIPTLLPPPSTRRNSLIL